MAGVDGPNGAIRRRTWHKLQIRYRLSERELAALEGIVSGDKLVETSTRLGIRDGTLRTYRRRALSKLGVDSAVEAIVLVVRADAR